MKLPKPFGMRWFGLYTLAVFVGFGLGVVVFGLAGCGIGTLLGQGVFGVIAITASERSRRARHYLLGEWGEA